MSDTFSPEERSRIMARVKSVDTAPELWVRSALHAAGFRFRLHQSDLPGKPDIVLRRFRTAVFVNGCFWHGHTCKGGTAPSSHCDYWTGKIGRNRSRDQQNYRTLTELGWSVVVIWECELKEQTAALVADLERAKAGLQVVRQRD